MARATTKERTETASIATPSREDFAAMLEQSFETQSPQEGSVIKGIILSIENDFAMVDVGLKTEGRISLKEFAMPGVPADIKVGDTVEVYLERVENALGEAVLSRDKARREESWIKLEKAFNDQTRVTGVIFGRVKGGFTVDLDGAVAFLPGSQVDVRPMRDVGPLMNQPQLFQILKMDRRRGNIVVSRRAVLEERRAEERTSLVASLQEKQIVEGVVKNITDYGAFVDLGGVDGLLHVTDIAWRRVSHPTEVLQVGQTVTVQIIKINHETQRISLGMKQLQTDPWEGVAAKYPVGVAVQGQGHQRHRLWRLCGAGAGRRRPGPCQRNVLGEEEHRPLQAGHTRRGSGRPGAGSGFQQAPHQPGPEADPGKSLECLHRQPSGGHGDRGRDQVHHRVRPVRRPGQRH